MIEDQASLINLLAISFAFPPVRLPQSIQISRLLSGLDANVTLICADWLDIEPDITIYPGAEESLHSCVRVPYGVPGTQKFVNRVAFRAFKGYWYRRNRVPDEFIGWKRAVLNAIPRIMQDSTPNLVASFSHPHTDHLIGLEIKRQFGLPWIAHFSDPWVDNQFADFNDATLSLNRSLEKDVIENADLVVMTSEETVDLVFRKYPSDLKAKARVLPHCYDPRLFSEQALLVNDKIVIRYLGSFYGRRSPVPLLVAIRKIMSTKPQLLEKIRIEFVGDWEPDRTARELFESVPRQLISNVPSVQYQTSLDLMVASDGLLVIDAPDSLSVFLPSKLIEYVGSGTPIMGFTPNGAAANVIESLGGIVADPGNETECAERLEDFILLLEKRRRSRFEDFWGNADVRERFEVKTIANQFQKLCAGLVDRTDQTLNPERRISTSPSNSLTPQTSGL